jgi:hypothetical protein
MWKKYGALNDFVIRRSTGFSWKMTVFSSLANILISSLFAPYSIANVFTNKLITHGQPRGVPR